ncbi:MAG: methionyl-tRNA formyltransferase [Bacteroidaceae bacterium]|nr:methionyl-tRNA formyltransferase [Bacteroidaceae bacterium]
MGTPDFAVESLRRLVESGKDVVAVVTMPDKAVGRHHDTLQASPVKQYAVTHEIPILQPERLKDESFLAELRALKADLQVVVAFRMLPEVVWAMPRLGTFNLHAALLPQYRGAAPINWAVINGDRETGVTTFFLDHNIDTGRIIHRVSTPIADTDTAGDIHDRLMVIGADLVLRTVENIEAGNIETVEQEELICAQASDSAAGSDGCVLRPAPKIFKETCEIRWDKHSVKSAYDFIRGLSPYPGAWTTLRSAGGNETTLKIFFAEKELTGDGSTRDSVDSNGFPVITDGKTYLKVALPDGFLRITSLQLAGKRRMNVEDFLRGNHLDGSRFVINKD